MELDRLKTVWVKGMIGVRTVPKAGQSAISEWCAAAGFVHMPRDKANPDILVYAAVRDPHARFISAIAQLLRTRWNRNSLLASLNDGQVPEPVFWPQYVYHGADTIPVLLGQWEERMGGELRQINVSSDDQLTEAREIGEKHWWKFAELYRPDYELLDRAS